MKILYLVRNEGSDTLDAFIQEHRKEHEVTVLRVRDLQDYDGLIDQLFAADKVISW